VIDTVLRSTALLFALATSNVFAQDTSPSSELSAKALFYNSSGGLTQVNSQGSGRKVSSAKPSVAVASNAHKGGAERPLALRASVLLATADGKTVELKPSHKFHTGDRVKLAFSTNKAGYFYLVTIGSSGKAQILAPRPGEPVRVETGNRYTFPSSPTGYFRFDSTKGQEEIWAVLSDEPLAALNMGQGVVTNLPQQPGSPTPGNLLVVADLSTELSGKDLTFEEDSTALFASAKPVSMHTGSNSKPPVIVKLLLKHE